MHWRRWALRFGVTNKIWASLIPKPQHKFRGMAVLISAKARQSDFSSPLSCPCTVLAPMEMGAKFIASDVCQINYADLA